MKFGVRMLPWSPLNGGRLSGLYRKGKPYPFTPRMKDEGAHKQVDNQIDLLESLALLAEQNGTTLPRLAYAFLYSKPHVASVIVGPRTIEHLDEAIAALDVKVTEELGKQIDERVKPGSAPDYIGW